MESAGNGPVCMPTQPSCKNQIQGLETKSQYDWEKTHRCGKAGQIPTKILLCQQSAAQHKGVVLGGAGGRSCAEAKAAVSRLGPHKRCIVTDDIPGSMRSDLMQLCFSMAFPLGAS